MSRPMPRERCAGTFCVKATLLEGQHRVPDGIAAAERCLALNPTYAGAYLNLALLHFFLADPEKMLEYADRGIRLSPRDPQTSIFLLIKGWAYFMLEQDEEALRWLRRVAAASPETPTILAALTSDVGGADDLAGCDAALNSSRTSGGVEGAGIGTSVVQRVLQTLTPA